MTTQILTRDRALPARRTFFGPLARIFNPATRRMRAAAVCRCSGSSITVAVGLDESSIDTIALLTATAALADQGSLARPSQQDP